MEWHDSRTREGGTIKRRGSIVYFIHVFSVQGMRIRIATRVLCQDEVWRTKGVTKIAPETWWSVLWHCLRSDAYHAQILRNCCHSAAARREGREEGCKRCFAGKEPRQLPRKPNDT